ncbi:MAG TPA: hypothetical protein VNN81_00965 [Bradyrhizobium sp.]|nr:hypothetical protein [Bradyrhizobium sp.]
MRSSRLLAVLSVVGLWASATAAASLNPEDAAVHIGETATVCGVVASATDHARLGERTDGLVVPRVWPRPKCRKDSPATALRLTRRVAAALAIPPGPGLPGSQ